MKRSILIGILLLSSFSLVTAQIYTPSGTIQGSSGNNNVGIGISNPQGKLSILGGVSGVNAEIFRFNRDDANRYNSIYSYSMDQGLARISFLIHDGITTTSQKMVMSLRGDGRVGVNTISPGVQFDVSGSGASSGIRTTDGTGLLHGGIGIRTANRAEIHLHSTGQNIPADLMFGHDSRTDANVRWTISDRGAADGRLIFFEGPRNTGAGFIDRVHFKGGDVGIGVNPVNARLHIEGNGTYDGVLRLKNTGTSGGDAFFVASNSSWDIGGNKLGIGLGSPTSGNVKMVIQSDGRIGIGTHTPAYKLDVCGTIRAKEIKVDLEAGCDFVFKSDYNLMSLNELEQFVRTNQHLPGIAPEEEMIEDGVNMKEMQMKLLQKIEELTLYAIEQNKKISELEKQNKRIHAIEREIIKLKSTAEE